VTCIYRSVTIVVPASADAMKAALKHSQRFSRKDIFMCGREPGLLIKLPGQSQKAMARRENTNTIIIGAGAAGLSCAVCLQRRGISCTVLEESAAIGATWEKRYDRLHLHTTGKHSQLPYFKMPESYPRYVPKDAYADYLRGYALEFNVNPLFNRRVTSIKREDEQWITKTSLETYLSENIIIATGCAGKPVYDVGKGIGLFTGEVTHSCEYRSGHRYADKRVLVIGFGNSACEIALCLHEHGAFPSLSVRGCVNVLPREIAGISVVDIALMQKWLIEISPILADAANTPVLAMVNGNIGKYGLKKCAYGPLTQITKQRKIPLIDIGTMELIRSGKITVFPGVQEFGADSVTFTDGRAEHFDAIILATGYVPAMDFLSDYDNVCDAEGVPLVSGEESALPGLYFCGFRVSPTGMLREIGIEAKRITQSISIATKALRH